MTHTIKDLVTLLAPLVKEATMLDLEQLEFIPKDSQKKSHFGGDPYFKMDDEWPISVDGYPYDFICQIYNEKEVALNNEIKLIQFFYDHRQRPWFNDDDGWLVKIFKSVNLSTMKKIDRPNELGKVPFCRINFNGIKTLPDWNTIDRYLPGATDIAMEIDDSQPWVAYQQACAELGAFHNLQSQVGGYPNFLQSDCTPTNGAGEPFQLLLQIDSEDNAGLMWSDMGLVYIFYDRDSDKPNFTLQSM